MKNFRTLGILAILMGGALLSIEMYGLKIIQAMEMMGKSSWMTDAVDYTQEPAIGFALFVTGGIITLGLGLIYYDVRKAKAPKDEPKAEVQ